MGLFRVSFHILRGNNCVSISCPSSGIVFNNFVLFFSALVTVWCFYDVAGRHWVKLKKYQQSLRDREQVVIAQTVGLYDKYFLTHNKSHFYFHSAGLPKGGRQPFSCPVYGRRQGWDHGESQGHPKVQDQTLGQQSQQDLETQVIYDTSLFRLFSRYSNKANFTMHNFLHSNIQFYPWENTDFGR